MRGVRARQSAGGGGGQGEALAGAPYPLPPLVLSRLSATTTERSVMVVARTYTPTENDALGPNCSAAGLGTVT
jgi:hypothetical protein